MRLMSSSAIVKVNIFLLIKQSAHWHAFSFRKEGAQLQKVCRKIMVQSLAG